MADQDPTNLHDLAVDVSSDIRKLAVGLAHAGAAPQAVAQLTKMADIVDQVVKVLAAGPVGEQAQAGPPPPGQPQPGPQAPPPGPPQAAAPGPAAPPPLHHALHAAAHATAAAMQQAAASRRG